MRPITNIKQSFINIGSAKLRSFLAVLGIVVGTASIVALISSSELATEHAISEFKSLGTNLISLQISENSENGNSGNNNLEIYNIPQIQQASDQIELIAPYINAYGNTSFNGKKLEAQVIAATPEIYQIMKLSLKDGRFVQSIDHYNTYAVIGSSLAEKLRIQGVSNTIGSKIRINNHYFTVIGVLNTSKRSLFLYADLNKSIIIPIQSSAMLNPEAHIDNVIFRVKEGSDLNHIQEIIKKAIHSINPTYRLYFENPNQITNIVAKQRKSFTWLLGFVGAISLIVGGIGVMNIMLVSVIERRQEIGIRLAIGARQKDILIMFVSESIALTCLGGIIGIILGLSITYVIGRLSGWGYYFFATPVLLGFAVSVGSGLISGIYPAYQASRLDPVSTLQSK